MRKTFIETQVFTNWLRKHLSDDLYALLQLRLLADPNSGDVMPGCGGLRKLRIADPSRGKGKRGGARLIYLHIEEADQIHLIAGYGKDEKDDLSAADKKILHGLVATLKANVQVAGRRERP